MKAFNLLYFRVWWNEPKVTKSYLFLEIFFCGRTEKQSSSIYHKPYKTRGIRDLKSFSVLSIHENITVRR